MPHRVVELFAGVGGFRLGLEVSGWRVVWSNQWEPGRLVQHASDCYARHFGPEGHSNHDIAKIPLSEVPRHDLLVGGFPCQDYSVATTQAEGIHGKKGVLWWEIHRLLTGKRPPYLLLENVDRLLKSPTPQRGRDFGVMLRCLADLGYHVEWRVLNAADYSAPQKRRRTFILGAQADTPWGEAMAEAENKHDWLLGGFFASEFAVARPSLTHLIPPPPSVVLPAGLQETSDRCAFGFENAGVMVEGKVWTKRAEPQPEPAVSLGSVLERGVGEEFYVAKKDVAKWEYLKGAKSEPRKADNGYEYAYTEGALPFPDPLDRPARTVMTDEGGLSPSRFRHIIKDPERGEYRVLTPVEAERLNQFPDDWTNTGMPRNWRYFCMGNALVVGLVRRMGQRLLAPPRETLPRVPTRQRLR